MVFMRLIVDESNTPTINFQAVRSVDILKKMTGYIEPQAGFTYFEKKY